MSEFSHVPRFRQGLKSANHVKPAVLSTHDMLIPPVTDSHFDSSYFQLLLSYYQITNVQIFKLNFLSKTTDLESVTEINRDCTNMEQRKEVEGKTWAGVCRSCRPKNKNKTRFNTQQTNTSIN